MKSLGLTAGLGIVGLLGAACGQATTSGSGSSASGTGGNTTAKAPAAAPAKTAALKGKIEYWDWWNTADSPTHEAWFAWVKEHFEKKYPGTEYQYVHVPFGQYLDKLTASAAAGTPPDTLHSSVAWGRDFWDRGILQDLNAQIARTPDVAMGKFLKASQFTNQRNGKIFGIPMEGPDAAVIGYNEDHFREVGLDPSPEATSKWSWDDFVKNTQKLTKRAGGEVQRAGYGGIGGGVATFTYWLYANNGQFYSKDQTKVAFNDSKGQAALEAMRDVQTKHNVTFPEGKAPKGNLFYTGNASMANLGTWSINYVTENVKELNWNMMAYPKGPSAARQGTTTWMNMVVMPKGIKNPDVSWAFMAWFSSLDTQINRMKIISRVAPRYDFFESAAFKEEASKVKQLKEVPRIAELGGSYPFIRISDFNKEVGPFITDAINGKIGIREALAQAEEKGNQILAEAAAGK